MSSRIGKIASLTSIIAGATATRFATDLQLCSRQGNEIFYNLEIENLI